MACDTDTVRGEPLVTGYWQRNLLALSQYRPALRAAIEPAAPAGAGPFSLPFIEPWAGIDAHLDTVAPEAQGLVVFLGLGQGHGPLRIQQQRPNIAQFAILEPSLDLFRNALRTLDLCPLIQDPRVVFFVGDFDWEELERTVTRVGALEDTHILRHVPSFQWRPELYGPLNDRAYMLLNQINASGSTTRKCGDLFMENRLAALSLLPHAHGLDALRGILAGKPAVVVAAGPSLAQSLPMLSQMAGRCAVIAADSALAPLLRAGIVPDLVTSIDYLDLNFEKLAPFVGQEWPFSLVSLSKATPLLAKRFPARHLFLAFADDLPQRWIIEALGVNTLAPVCSSVAHLSLGLALIMGCSPVVFLGQDLSYTNASLDHADGTIIMRQELPQDREILMVPAIGGGLVPTDRQFLSLMKAFEDIINGWPGRYINASAAGARIQGTEEMRLADLAGELPGAEFSVAELISEAVDRGPSLKVATFVQAAKERLTAVGDIQARLAQVVALGAEARQELSRLAHQRKVWRDFANLPAKLQDLLARFDAVNGAIDQANDCWEQVVELTFAMLSDNDRWRQDNDRLRDRQGYLPWVRAEVERIDHLNQARQGVVDRYVGLLTDLVTHLDQEERLGPKGEQPPGGPELVAHHLRAKDYLLAARAIASLPPAMRQTPQVLLATGEAKAGLLDFSGAQAAWDQALALDSSAQAQVAAWRHQFGAEWLGFVERYANPGEGGDNFPHLLPVWLERIVGAAGGRDEAAPLLRPVFDGHCHRLAALLDQGQALAEAVDMPSAWRLVFDGQAALYALQAKVYAAQGEPGRAIAEMERALALAPGNCQWAAFVVRALLAMDRFAEGIARLRAAVVANPKAALLWEEIGDTLSAAGNHNDAALAYEYCFLALPAHLDALAKMGQAYHRLGRLEAAAAAYEAVLHRDPSHGPASQLLATLR